MRRTVIGILIVLVVLTGILLTNCYRKSSNKEKLLAPNQVVDSFYQACKNHSYDLAKSYLSTTSINYFNAQQQQNPDKGLEAFIDYCAASLSVPEFSSLNFQNEKINNNTATIDTGFVYQNLEPNIIPHHLVKDEQGWHIDMVSTLEQVSPEPPKKEAYKQLVGSGRWLQHPKYGSVWKPTEVGYSWQPYYQDGKFSSTKDGWQWESERSWGDEVFHHGRWTQAGPWGWVWVPDDRYAPSWVTWRANEEYVGWAPLAPGIESNDKEKAYILPSNAWVFVTTKEFVKMVNSGTKTKYALTRKPVKESSKIISNSTPYVGVNSSQGRLVNEGISTDFLEKASGEKLISRQILSPPKLVSSIPAIAGVTKQILNQKQNPTAFLPPGQGGIPPGQAKKLEQQRQRDLDQQKRLIEAQKQRLEKEKFLQNQQIIQARQRQREQAERQREVIERERERLERLREQATHKATRQAEIQRFKEQLKQEREKEKEHKKFEKHEKEERKLQKHKDKFRDRED